MTREHTIAILGTFDSKGEEHLFLKERIEKRGLGTLTINLGTKAPPAFRPDYDLFPLIKAQGDDVSHNRDRAIGWISREAQKLILGLYERGLIHGVICAGGGTGTHLGTNVMRALPLGVPKVMVSTVASRDMKMTVGTRDITMIHSVVDVLGVNSILGRILDQAAGAVCGMVQAQWKKRDQRRRIALTFFGFITDAAMHVKGYLERLGYEVIAFHANGTGGMAMEEMARDGYFTGVLDLALHELADDLMGGYCKGIGPERLMGPETTTIPRLVVPGGLDCAVLEFTQGNIPEEYRDRKIFFYDFRSAIRLTKEETLLIADRVAEKLNDDPFHVKVLIPRRGWSEADHESGPLWDPSVSRAFVDELRKALDDRIEIKEIDLHINDQAFAQEAARTMHEMVQSGRT
ncbi:MAG: Tm-1-like ATP-binding domain-containing protein [Deltaproteobacteria bacterium]|nr:Tm-1-like ATP-binding domain-containing protein [Deltaproteobacteria bacterium]